MNWMKRACSVRVKELIVLHQDRMNCAADIVELTEMFFQPSVRLENDEARAVLAEPSAQTVLGAFRGNVAAMEKDAFTVEGIKAAIKAVQQETGVKGKGLFMPIRVALTGQMHGPDLNATVWLLGQERVLQRLAEAAGG